MRFVRRFSFFVFALIAAPAFLRSQTTPVLRAPLPAQSLAAGASTTPLDLKNYFTVPGVNGRVAQVDTVAGKFNIELLSTDAPKTVDNFLSYVGESAYDNSVIHRSVPGFVIQGGGYTVASNALKAIDIFPPVQNEFKLSNVRGTLAMAKSEAGPDTATSQWFVNLTDNSANLDKQNGGFTVFARVLGTGMSVVDEIAAARVVDASAQLGAAFNQLPLRGDAVSQENLFIVRSVKTVPIYPTSPSDASVLTFAATTSNPHVVTAAITDAALTLTPVAAGSATVTVIATDTNGNTATGVMNILVAAAPGRPVITAHPQPLVALASGSAGTVVFSVDAIAVPAPNFQWRLNGRAVEGATRATLVLTGATAAQAGNYTCVVSNSFGPVESIAGVLAFVPSTNPGRLINLSVLAGLSAGETLTMGTVLGGANTSGNKALLARAAGPALTQLGVSGVLPDPQMSLLSGGSGTVVASNNDWGGTTALVNAFTQVGAFAYASPTSKDAALLAPSLAPGNYTVQVKDAGAGIGSAIAELYDSTLAAAFTPTTPRLVNVSVLKEISAGATLTAGFVVGGTTFKTVLLRAVGPGLKQFGVSGAMADPQLSLFNGANKIAENDNWGGDAQLTSVGTRVGAFAISDLASKDAILVFTLGPGNYSAQVGDVNGAGGSALVEVYEVP